MLAFIILLSIVFPYHYDRSWCEPAVQLVSNACFLFAVLFSLSLSYFFLKHVKMCFTSSFTTCATPFYENDERRRTRRYLSSNATITSWRIIAATREEGLWKSLTLPRAQLLALNTIAAE